MRKGKQKEKERVRKKRERNILPGHSPTPARPRSQSSRPATALGGSRRLPLAEEAAAWSAECRPIHRLPSQRRDRCHRLPRRIRTSPQWRIELLYLLLFPQSIFSSLQNPSETLVPVESPRRQWKPPEASPCGLRAPPRRGVHSCRRNQTSSSSIVTGKLILSAPGRSSPSSLPLIQTTPSLSEVSNVFSVSFWIFRPPLLSLSRYG
jgi:hypothetical protein